MVLLNHIKMKKLINTMSESGDVRKIFNKIREPVAWQVGAELKKNYNKLKLIMELGDNPANLASDISDEEFEKMASHAISERELEVRMTGEKGHYYLSFEQINNRIAAIDDKTQKEMGINGFNINSLIPEDPTIAKVSNAVLEVETDIKSSTASKIGIFLSTLFNFIGSLLGSIFGKGESISWEDVQNKETAKYAQKSVEKKLTELAERDYPSSVFLNQEINGATVKDSIVRAVPQSFYEESKLPVPVEHKIEPAKNPIPDTTMEPAPEIHIDDTISMIRNRVLQGKSGKEGSLSKEIAKNIIDESNEKLVAANAAHDSLSWTSSPIEKGKALAVLDITRQFAVNEEEAQAVANKMANLIAAGFEDSVKDPKFASLKTKEEAAEFIAGKIETQIEANKDGITIVKSLTNDNFKKAVNFVEYASERFEFVRNKVDLTELPPQIGENQYAVVNADNLKPRVLEAVRNSVTNETFASLKLASDIILAKTSAANEVAKSEEEPSKQEKPEKQSSAPRDTDDKSKLVFNNAKEACSTKLGAAHDCPEGEMIASTPHAAITNNHQHTIS